MKKLLIEIDDKQHEKFKLKCVKVKESMKDVVAKLIAQYLGDK